jgi:nucleoside-diphosphate-sugar epimerase
MTGANDGLASGGIASGGLASEGAVNGAASDWAVSGGASSGPGRRLRLVVLGASGFLGRHVRQRACAAGLDVVTAGRSPLPDSSAHCLIDLGAQDPARLAGTLSTLAPDVVVNCAGATSGPPEALAAVNVTGTYDLVRAMLMAGRSARLVHLGSAAEYGPGEPGTAVAESAPPRPASAYGATKLAGTRLVELGRAAGLDAVVLRVFNPVGPGAPDGILPGRLVSEFRRALADGSEVQLGPLDAVRDFVDARDVADAVIAAALAPGPTAPTGPDRPDGSPEGLPEAVINVASGQGRPARTLARELAAISGYDGPVHENTDGSPRSAVPSWQQADIGLARRVLGWQPRRDLGESLADLWEECRDPASR